MVGTNSYITKLKAQLDQAIIQREHWKQLAENRNSIVVTEVCPESRSVEEYTVDADSVRASWRLIRSCREQIEAMRAENEQLRDGTKRIDAYWQSELRDCRNERDALAAELEAIKRQEVVDCKVVPVDLIERTICRLTHGHEHDKAVRELRALLAGAEGVKDE